jgi:hypothetical protein
MRRGARQKLRVRDRRRDGAILVVATLALAAACMPAGFVGTSPRIDGGGFGGLGAGHDEDVANNGDGVDDAASGRSEDASGARRGDPQDEDDGRAGGRPDEDDALNGNVLQCKGPQRTVLVLDFKSGWWAGDGGEAFSTILAGLTAACQGLVQVEYHHILQHVLNSTTDLWHANLLERFPRRIATGGSLAAQPWDLATGFDQADFRAYDQIWILSGADADPQDVPPSDPFFQGIVAKVAASGAHVFVGAGYGSIAHANAMATALGVGAPFATDLPEAGRTIYARDGIQVLTSVRAGVEIAAHPLTTGVSALAEVVRATTSTPRAPGAPPPAAEPDVLRSDRLLPAPGLRLVARGASGAPAFGTVHVGDRRIVLDAGMQRYYGLSSLAGASAESLSTSALLRNVSAYLARP